MKNKKVSKEAKNKMSIWNTNIKKRTAVRKMCSNSRRTGERKSGEGISYVRKKIKIREKKSI